MLAEQATVLSQQDPRDVVELFSRHMGFIFQATLEDPKLLRTFQKLLDSPCHRQFASVLLQFLLDERMGSLRRPESKATPLPPFPPSSQSTIMLSPSRYGPPVNTQLLVFR